MAIAELWTFTIASPGIELSNVDLTGFKVEARDGSIGKVDVATHEAGGSFVVVDTGPWILGKKVMLPAGVVRDVDLTKDEIKNAPEFDEKIHSAQSYPNEIGEYYRGRQEARSAERW